MRNLISIVVSFTILALAILLSFAYATSYPRLEISSALGISSAINITPENAASLQLDRPYGILIISVQPGSPIDKAGIQGSTVMVNRDGGVGGDQITFSSVGDVIVGADGKPVKSIDDIYPILDTKHKGDTLRLTIVRGAGEGRPTILDLDVVLS